MYKNNNWKLKSAFNNNNNNKKKKNQRLGCLVLWSYGVTLKQVFMRKIFVIHTKKNSSRLFMENKKRKIRDNKYEL